MDDMALANALNEFVLTEDGSPITPASSYFQTTLRESLLLHNQSLPELMAQAFVGRYFMRSGERVVVSLANKRLKRREVYSELRHTLLEMMLVVTMATIAYLLVKVDAT